MRSVFFQFHNWRVSNGIEFTRDNLFIAIYIDRNVLLKLHLSVKRFGLHARQRRIHYKRTKLRKF